MADVVKADEAKAALRLEAAGEPVAELAELIVVGVLSDLTISVSMAGVARVEVSVGTVRLPAAEVSKRLPSRSVSKFGPVVVTMSNLANEELCVLRIWKD